jgi:uroporphyrinogen decarboxylase
MSEHPMTSRERVRHAINFREPDRVPIDIGGSYLTSICIDAYAQLRDHLGISGSLPRVNELMYMLAETEEEVRVRLHGDVIELASPLARFNIARRDWKPWRNEMGTLVQVPGGYNPIDEGEYLWIRNEQGQAIARMPKGGLYFDYAQSLSELRDFEPADLKAWQKNQPSFTDEQLRTLEKQAQNLHTTTDYAVCGGFYKSGATMFPSVAGHSFAEWLCILMTETEYARTVIEISTDCALKNLQKYMDAVGNWIDLIVISTSDFGSQQGELFHPQKWRDVYLSGYKKLNDYVHKHSSAKTFYHSCGSIYHLIPSFIEAGVDILNPVQVTAAGMDANRLKAEFGGKIVFWGGGIDTQTVLPFGSTDDVRRQVRERINIFAPGGGFVFAPVHDIQYGVRPENILSMVDAVMEYGAYPIAHAQKIP